MRSVNSINGVPIELTDERWEHIADGHAEIANRQDEVIEVISAPDMVLEGDGGELIAVRRSGQRGWMVVVYKERLRSGFVVTAFRTTRGTSLDRRKQVWP